MPETARHLGRLLLTGRRPDVIRIRFLKPIPVAIVAAGAALAVAAAALASPGPATATAPRMSAIVLANGVLFNQGPAARYLTALGQPATPVRGKLLKVERSVDHALQASPALAGAFARDIQSGNRIKVSAALTSLAKLAQSAFEDQYGAAATQQMITRAKAALQNAVPKAGDGTMAGSSTVNYVNFFNLIDDVVQLEVVLLVVVVLLLVVVIPEGFRDGSSGSLAADQIVNVVAVGLHAG
jgi:hypothetical protein